MPTKFPIALASGLRALIAPMSANEFVSEYWERRPLLIRLQDAVWRAVSTIGADLSIESLVAEHRGTVKVFDPERQGWDRSAASEELLEDHESGRTLYFLNCNESNPTLNYFLQAVALDLGARLGRVSIFASKTGSSMPAHFDTAGNFTVQLKGIKRWRFSEASAVRSPAANFGDGHAISGELRAHINEPPSWDKRDAVQVELVPGSVLYLPGGHWHETETETDSVALSFTLDAFSWADLILDRLRWSLLRKEEWRSNAFGPSKGDCPVGVDRAALMGRLSDLVGMASGLAMEDFVDASPSEYIDDETLVVRNLSANITIDQWDAEGKAVGTVSFGGPRSPQLSITGTAAQLRGALEVAEALDHRLGLPARACDVLKVCPFASLQTLKDLASMRVLRVSRSDG